MEDYRTHICPTAKHDEAQAWEKIYQEMIKNFYLAHNKNENSKWKKKCTDHPPSQ